MRQEVLRMPEIKQIHTTLPQSMVVVSNRGPVTITDSAEGLNIKSSVGGLVSAIEPVISQKGGTWVAWGGREETGKEEESPLLPLMPLPVGHPRYFSWRFL
jgi:trehalose 6-phosphate synthase